MLFAFRRKAVRPDGIPVELFKTALKGDPSLEQRLLDVVVWKEEGFRNGKTIPLSGCSAKRRIGENLTGACRIVTVCEAFSLTVSVAQTEIMRLNTRGIPDGTTTFAVEAAGQVYKKAQDFLYLGGNVNHDAHLFIEVGFGEV